MPSLDALGTEKNKDILIHFLNDILGLTDDNKIKDVSFLSPIQDPVIASQKQSIVDVLCVDSTGVKTIIEMVRPESLRSYCLKGEEFIQKETERILKLIKPDVLPSESTHQCESGNRLVTSDADNEPPLEKKMLNRERSINYKHHVVGGLG
ncbi:Rpn family recombination-promoting nuclease/putative transposase [Wolbachia endosymbiont of Listronotus oregonensis]|nr:PD-(D/E)XK nuclease family transposase [Wolbachia endosymbiont of Listronotus oregonensis]WMT84147.1 Rpn family recombination-promoting nuclease/putative transposase [Wolbachia endosymbiont of Listronotus oregonensis]